MNNTQTTKVITPEECRFSYCNLIKPVAKQEGGDLKYSVTVLLPKTAVTTKQLIDAAIEAATQNGVSKWGFRPPIVANPVYDGDGVRPSDGMPFGAECKGHWVFTASTKADKKPGLVDINRADIINPSEIYSGMYGRVSVNFFDYNIGSKRGVGCALNHVQKTRDGEPLVSVSSAKDDFAQFSAPELKPVQAPQGQELHYDQQGNPYYTLEGQQELQYQPQN